MASARRRELDIPRHIAAGLGELAVAAARDGYYLDEAGNKVELQGFVSTACAATRSIEPDASLPTAEWTSFAETRVRVANETTLGASLQLVQSGARPLALNFANGIQTGGGFLAAPARKRRCFVAPALCTKHLSMIRCMQLTASVNFQTPPIGPSILPMSPSSERMMERN
jgi:hypothetical protein